MQYISNGDCILDRRGSCRFGGLSLSQISTTTTQGSTTQGSTTQGSTTQGSTTQGSTTQGSTTQGSCRGMLLMAIPVAVVPARPMRLPRTQANPAEVVLWEQDQGHTGTIKSHEHNCILKECNSLLFRKRYMFCTQEQQQKMHAKDALCTTGSSKSCGCSPHSFQWCTGTLGILLCWS